MTQPSDTKLSRLSPKKLLKKLYQWVLSWAESKYGTLALAVLAFVESSFFPIPPDALQIALSVAKPKKSLWFAFISSLFSVIGGLFGYFIGFFLFESIGQALIHFFGYEQQFLVVGELFKNNSFLAISAAAFTPVPYKVFTIAAGFWKIELIPFIFGSIVGRAGRFFIEGILIYFLGAKIKNFIEKYFNLLAIAVFIVIVVGFASLKYFF